jgi:hypothetical protein
MPDDDRMPPMSIAEKRFLLWSFILIVLLAAAPVISAFSSIGIAQFFGCTVNEGGPTPCIVRGVDIGETLSVMFVMGWFGLMTLPAGALALTVWAVVFLVLWLRARRRA